jgi:hypothetical protein
MPGTTDWIDKKILGTLLIVVCVAAFLFYGVPYLYSLYYKPPAAALKYTTGLNAKLRVLNGTSGSSLGSGAAIQLQVFATGVDPFAYKFTGTPSFSAAWDTTSGSWMIGGVDAGTYTVLVKETSSTTTMCPIKVTVTVPGTDDEKKEVWCTPSTLSIYNLPTISVVNYDVANLTATKGAVSKVGCTYDGSNKGINGTNPTAGNNPYAQGSYWRITYDISAGAGITQEEHLDGPIRLYFTRLTEQFTFDQILVDGTAYTLTEDTNSADDGHNGMYAEVSVTWKNAESHTVQLFLTQSSAEGADATGHTLTLSIVGQFSCLNPTYRTWTDTTQAVACKDV